MTNEIMELKHSLSSDAFWLVNKFLAKSIGVYETLIISDLISKDDYFRDRGMLTDGFFFNTFENIQEDTSLTRKQCLKPIKHLEELGFLETKLKGIPAKKHFKIHHKVIREYLSSKPVCPKGQNLNDPKGNYINKNKDNKNKNNSSVTFQVTREYLENYLKRDLYEDELTSIRKNINKDLNIEHLVDDFKQWLIGEGLPLEVLDNDIRAYNISMVGYIYMYEHDYDKFINISKSMY